MWVYDKKLQYPVDIKKPDPRMATLVVAQYGGPDGEIGASLRYLSQRFSMITQEAKATLNDIGTEELAHLEMVGTMVRQLMEGASDEEIKRAGAEAYYVGHGRGVYPQSAGGVPLSAAAFQSKGDPLTDLYEDLAADAAILQGQQNDNVDEDRPFPFASGYQMEAPDCGGNHIYALCAPWGGTKSLYRDGMI